MIELLTEDVAQHDHVATVEQHPETGQQAAAKQHRAESGKGA